MPQATALRHRHRVEIGELDIALVTMPAAASRALVVTRLLTDPLRALLPAAMAAERSAVTAAELAHLPLIRSERGGSIRAIVDGWFRRAGVTLSPVTQLDSIETTKVLAGRGLGASIMPQLALAALLAGTVAMRLRPAAARELGVVPAREKLLSRGIRLVIEALHARPAKSRPPPCLLPARRAHQQRR